MVTFLFSVLTFSLNLSNAFAYPKAVAAIINYDDLAGRLTITRAHGEPGGHESLLYPGDQITGDVDAIKFGFVDYANFYFNGRAYVITFNPPSKIEELLQKGIAYIESCYYNVERYVEGVSLGILDDLNLKPQPGFEATLFYNQNVIFAWENSNHKIFTIKDEHGKKIFEKKIEGLTSIDINPSSIKLKAGQNYTWNFDVTGKNYKFTLFDENAEKEILSQLATIDSENISANEKILKKAAYVQLLSDAHSDTIDLYWLSLQLLIDFKPSTKHEEKLQEILLKRCENNLNYSSQ